MSLYNESLISKIRNDHRFDTEKRYNNRQKYCCNKSDINRKIDWIYYYTKYLEQYNSKAKVYNNFICKTNNCKHKTTNETRLDVEISENISLLLFQSYYTKYIIKGGGN
jgi:hypothetical protein